MGIFNTEFLKPRPKWKLIMLWRGVLYLLGKNFWKWVILLLSWRMIDGMCVVLPLLLGVLILQNQFWGSCRLVVEADILFFIHFFQFLSFFHVYRKWWMFPKKSHFNYYLLPIFGHVLSICGHCSFQVVLKWL